MKTTPSLLLQQTQHQHHLIRSSHKFWPISDLPSRDPQTLTAMRPDEMEALPCLSARKKTGMTTTTGACRAHTHALLGHIFVARLPGSEALGSQFRIDLEEFCIHLCLCCCRLLMDARSLGKTFADISKMLPARNLTILRKQYNMLTKTKVSQTRCVVNIVLFTAALVKYNVVRVCGCMHTTHSAIKQPMFNMTASQKSGTQTSCNPGSFVAKSGCSDAAAPSYEAAQPPSQCRSIPCGCSCTACTFDSGSAVNKSSKPTTFACPFKSLTHSL